MVPESRAMRKLSEADTGSIGGFQPARREVVSKSASRKSLLIFLQARLWTATTSAEGIPDYSQITDNTQRRCAVHTKSGKEINLNGLVGSVPSSIPQTSC